MSKRADLKLKALSVCAVMNVRLVAAVQQLAHTVLIDLLIKQTLTKHVKLKTDVKVI